MSDSDADTVVLAEAEPQELTEQELPEFRLIRAANGQEIVGAVVRETRYELELYAPMVMQAMALSEEGGVGFTAFPYTLHAESVTFMKRLILSQAEPTRDSLVVWKRLHDNMRRSAHEFTSEDLPEHLKSRFIHAQDDSLQH